MADKKGNSDKKAKVVSLSRGKQRIPKKKTLGVIKRRTSQNKGIQTAKTQVRHTGVQSSTSCDMTQNQLVPNLSQANNSRDLARHDGTRYTLENNPGPIQIGSGSTINYNKKISKVYHTYHIYTNCNGCQMEGQTGYPESLPSPQGMKWVKTLTSTENTPNTDKRKKALKSSSELLCLPSTEPGKSSSTEKKSKKIKVKTTKTGAGKQKGGVKPMSADDVQDNVTIMDFMGRALKPGDLLRINNTNRKYAVYVGNTYVVRHIRNTARVVKKKLELTEPFTKLTLKSNGACQVYNNKRRVKRGKLKKGKEFKGKHKFDFLAWVSTGQLWQKAHRRGLKLVYSS